jgi:hypothetical protein
MTVRMVPMTDVPGAGLQDALRMLMAARDPWLIVIDARGFRPGTLSRFATLLRLRRQARRRGGDLAVVVDDAMRLRLVRAGLQRWLPLADSVEQARRLLLESGSQLPAAPAASPAVPRDAARLQAPIGVGGQRSVGGGRSI